MPKHTINWVNDHIQICDRLDERGAAELEGRIYDRKIQDAFPIFYKEGNQ